MSIASAIRRMLDAGLTIEQALIAAESFEAETRTDGIELTKRQARNKRYYDSHKTSEKRLNSDYQDVSDGADGLLSPVGSPPIPPSPNPQSSVPPSPPKGGSSPAGFADFWSAYPHKVGKPVAEKSFIKALRRADLATIMAGLEAYVAKTDDRPWCNPSTWLNQDRWNDAPSTPPLRRSQAPPPQTPHQQRHQAAINAFDRHLGIKPDDEFTGSTIDLAERDYRSH
ncbi:MAG: hypothetical protein QHC90_13265 [Shinella sp.]|nr:hypothetical protein [Shinella sp.]